MAKVITKEMVLEVCKKSVDDDGEFCPEDLWIHDDFDKLKMEGEDLFYDVYEAFHELVKEGKVIPVSEHWYKIG